jgi:hypothetical protein
MKAVQRSDDERVAYLVDALQRNPLQDAEGLLERRRVYHGCSTTVATAASLTQVRDQREIARGRVEEIRENFWVMTPAELKRALESLDTSAYPDLHQVVQRLRILADNRPKLAKIAQHRDFDGDLFSSLKRVLVLPSRAAEGAREKAVKSRNTHQQVKAARKMAALLKAQVPAIYEIEASWLDRLSRKSTATPAPAQSRAGWAFSGWFEDLGSVSWIGAIVLLIVLRLALRAWSRGGWQ